MKLFHLIFLFCCLGSTLNLSAQQSCYEQYLLEHDMPFLTTEDADDSYEELKKTAIAYERMSEEAGQWGDMNMKNNQQKRWGNSVVFQIYLPSSHKYISF